MTPDRREKPRATYLDTAVKYWLCPVCRWLNKLTSARCEHCGENIPEKAKVN